MTDLRVKLFPSSSKQPPRSISFAHQMLSQQLPLPLEAPEQDQHHASISDADRELQFKLLLAELSQGRIVDIQLTNNRSTILSARPVKDKQLSKLPGLPRQVRVRIHRCFLEASDDVLHAAAEFASKRLTKIKRREALDALRNHFDQHAPSSEEAPIRPTRLHGPKGAHHDLEPLFERLNHDYFDSSLSLTVSWGAPPRRRRRRRRTILLGSFHDESQTIRIHPVLDHREVPSYVVESVLHHEMVHAVVPAERHANSTRRRIHTAEFRRLEREFEQLEQAETWLQRHLFKRMGRLEREQERQR